MNDQEFKEKQQFFRKKGIILSQTENGYRLNTYMPIRGDKDINFDENTMEEINKLGRIYGITVGGNVENYILSMATRN
jgi:hypothetical protein